MMDFATKTDAMKPQFILLKEMVDIDEKTSAGKERYCTKMERPFACPGLKILNFPNKYPINIIPKHCNKAGSKLCPKN